MSIARNVELINRALVAIGAEEIATDEGTSTEAVVCKRLYKGVVEELLGRYRWRFAAELVKPSLLPDAPLVNYSSAWRMPTGYDTTVDAVYVNGTSAKFERFGRDIHCDAEDGDEVVIEVRGHPDEQQWPSYFDAVVVDELAAAIAIPLTEDVQRASYFKGEALRQFTTAATLDAQSRSARKLPVGGLRRWHRGRP